MYLADADGRGLSFFWRLCFWAYIDLRGPIGARPRVRPLGSPPPPPPTHHDPMKIYRVYRYLQQQKYTLFVDLHVNLFFCINLWGPIGARPRVRPRGSPPPPRIMFLCRSTCQILKLVLLVLAPI